MSKYKSLIEIIQDMKDGDVADSRDTSNKSFIKRGNRYYWLHEKDEHQAESKPMAFNASTFEIEYQIRIKTFGFDEALEHIKKGRGVFYNTRNGQTYISSATQLRDIGAMAGHEGLTLNQFISDGRFTLKMYEL
jgi:hypothetical protein